MLYMLSFFTPVGFITLTEANGALVSLTFEEGPLTHTQNASTLLLNRAKEQLLQYFAGERQLFDLPVALKGTPFQQRVWDCLRAIPYGETRTYGEIACQIKCTKGYRAVGMANNRNPIAIIIPCHRVVGKGGELTGYAGGLERKQHLLRVEGALLPTVEKK